jgi:serine/threonine protein phosphatase PrpC
MSAHVISLKGDRTSNEDNHNVIIGFNEDNDKMARINYYGVYDGHGGKFVSKFLSDNMHHFFTGKTVKYPLDKKYVDTICDELQNVLFTKYEKNATACGSTCLVVCHFKKYGSNYLNIINTGDSRCVLCKNNLGVPLTKDHKPDWPDETNRITKLGGVIKLDGTTYRIGDLSVSRAFGDKEAKQFVTHKPDLYIYKITEKDKFIIIACDGLWDVVSPQDAVNFVLTNCYDADMKYTNQKVNIARKLAERAIGLESGDNVTCIVVFFDYNK